MSYEEQIAKILDTYTFEELLEYNDLTELDICVLLLKNELIHLPDVLPIDYEEEASEE